MKTTCQRTLVLLVALFIIATSTHAIEGLKLTIRCPDVVLSWPSVEGENYIVQFRETLSTNTPWITLTNYLPAEWGTNLTTFTHSNRVDCPLGEVFGRTSGGSEQNFQPIYPLLIPPDGSRPPVPLGIYPPGIDLAGYLILWPDGSTNEWSAKLVADWRTEQQAQRDGPQPQDAGEEPSCGFYRVVRMGVWLSSVTNGTIVSGIFKLPVEAGYEQGSLSSVTLSANNLPIEGTTLLSEPLPGLLSFAVDSRRLRNGDYYLQASGLWLLESTNEFDSAMAELKSPAVYVTVTNPVAYPDWIQDYRDDLMLIKITSVETEIDWQVDIYGETGDFVRSFTNHSTDGSIAFSWDLKDANNNSRTDSSFTTVTTLSSNGTPSVVETNPPLIKVVDSYPEQGMWMAARASYMPTSLQNYDLYTNVANYFALMGDAGGGTWPGLPYRNPGQILVLSKATGITNWAAMFRGFLTNHNVRNFYYDGHGGPDWIGYGWENGDQKRTFPASLVALALNNTVPNTNSIRYRWVWLDACQTAFGSWPQAFGLGNRENVPLDSYTSRPGAFCGFSEPVYAYTIGTSTINTSSIDFRNWFLYFWWFDDRTLADAFGLAHFWSGFNDFQYLKIFGYRGLRWNEYNTKAEWPPAP